LNLMLQKTSPNSPCSTSPRSADREATKRIDSRIPGFRSAHRAAVELRKKPPDMSDTTQTDLSQGIKPVKSVASHYSSPYR
jgi:hypothetical protein